MVGLFFKKQIMKETTEYQAGAALVDEGIEFDIDGFRGKKIRLTVKPTRPGAIVRISQKIIKLEPVNEGTIQEFLQKGRNIKIIAGIIATAVINKEFFKMWKYKFIKWLVLNRTKDMEHLFNLFLIVQRQMGPVFFYRIMSLTPAMNYLKKKPPAESKEEAKHFGEQSPSSKKPSDSPTEK